MTNHAAASPLAPDELALRRRALAAQLRRLRTGAQPRISQQAAAAYIGLSESTGYRSVGQWESGEVVPSSTWRGALRRYLWCALGLHARPAEFAELWEQIAIAWDWPPLTEVDWRELRALDCTQDGGAQAETEAAIVTAPAVTTPAGSAAPSLAALPPAQPAPPSAERARTPALLVRGKGWAPALLALAALLALLFFAVAFAPQLRAFNPLSRPASVTPSVVEANLGFEAVDELAPWTIVGDPACAQRMAGRAAAHSGGHFLRVDTTTALCGSLRYDLNSPPAAGATARFAVWARTAGPTTESVELVLWPGQRVGGDLTMGDKQFARFTVDNEQWRCLEVALPISAAGLDLVRAEFYFDPTEPVQIDLDEASLHFDGPSICQGQPPRPINPDFETGVRHLGWSFLEEDGCNWEVMTDRASSHSGRRYLRVERSTPQCASIYQDLSSAPVPGVTYRAAAWVRSANDLPVRANWVLWMVGEETASAEQRVAAGSQWRCVETALTAPPRKFDSLRLELYFESPAASYAIDDVHIATGDEPLCPPQKPLLNGGFEEQRPAPWEEIKQCLVTPIDGAAHSGAGFARAEKNADCASIFQDVFTPTKSGDTATFSAWVRAAGTTPARGRLALRASGATTELAELPFTLPDDNWTCLEVALETQAADVRFWRPEIYFSSDGAVYDVDDASFTLGAAGTCPQTNSAIQRLEWLPGTVGYPGSAVSGVVEIENLGGEATAWPHVLRYWLAEMRNGPPLYDEASGAITAPALAAGSGSGPLYFDLTLPPVLAGNEVYYLVMDSGATSPALQATQRRRSLPLELKPCAADSLFCDIPAGFWAQTEAEAWYTAGITSGCRSNTQAYLDLPFCPQQILSPDTMAVFLVRHLAEPGFNPAQPYRGIYADVPESHRRSLWIEALYDRLGPVARSNCPQIPGELRFCPQAPLLRADLLRYLAAAVPRKPNAAAASHFVDLTGDPELSALAAAFWRAGILPENDPACPDLGVGPRFCPQEPARRIDAAVWMVRSFTRQAAEQ